MRFKKADIPHKTSFGVRITGDSMTPQIHDGDIVWVEERLEIENGQIGIFTLTINSNTDSYCKKLNIEYHQNRRVVSLLSLNPKYEPIMVSDIDGLKTVGRVLL